MASHTSLSRIAKRESSDDDKNIMELRSKPAAGRHPVNDQPDGARDHGEVYVQVAVLSKKLGTKDDGTIILSPLSESLVSYPHSTSWWLTDTDILALLS